MDEAVGLNAQQDTEEDASTEQQRGGERGSYLEAGGCSGLRGGAAEGSPGRKAGSNLARVPCWATPWQAAQPRFTIAAVSCSALFAQHSQAVGASCMFWRPDYSGGSLCTRRQSVIYQNVIVILESTADFMQPRLSTSAYSSTQSGSGSLRQKRTEAVETAIAVGEGQLRPEAAAAAAGGARAATKRMMMWVLMRLTPSAGEHGCVCVGKHDALLHHAQVAVPCAVAVAGQ